MIPHWIYLPLIQLTMVWWFVARIIQIWIDREEYEIK